MLLLMLRRQGRSAEQQLLPRAPLQSGRRALIDRHNKRPTNLLGTLRRYRRLLMRSLPRRRCGALHVCLGARRGATRPCRGGGRRATSSPASSTTWQRWSGRPVALATTHSRSPEPLQASSPRWPLDGPQAASLPHVADSEASGVRSCTGPRQRRQRRTRPVLQDMRAGGQHRHDGRYALG